MNRGIAAERPSMNRYFEPSLACKGAKKKTWDRPTTIPEVDEKVPMALTERLRPPSSMGVERNSG